VNRHKAIELITQALTGDELVVSSTGLTNRELFAIKDSPKNFYMLGSMGLASSIGLGLALSLPDRQVIILDGDGACLMNMGAMATIGHFSPRNLVHIVLDNGCYGSTGKQPTVSDTIKLEEVARYAGYVTSKFVDSENDLRGIFRLQGPIFILVVVGGNNTEGIGRIPYSPEQIKERFQGAIWTLN